MTILIICTTFPPDSAISAVRPYMFAKYLTKNDFKVLVLCSGVLYKQRDNNYILEDAPFEILSYMSDDVNCQNKKSDLYIKNEFERILLSKKIIHRLYGTIKSVISANKRFNFQKRALLKIKDRGEKIDWVFSTYGMMENIKAGRFASKLFNAKWIMDFRDSPIKKGGIEYIIWNSYVKLLINKVLKKTIFCTAVSEDLTREIKSLCSKARVTTIYNGYEKIENANNSFSSSNKMQICYTGSVFGLEVLALKKFAKCISELIEEEKIEKDKIVFTYAGNEIDVIYDCFSVYNVSDVVEYKGYVDSLQIQNIQNKSDLFLVLSWNTKKSQGIITGKFYEGIRARKPILAIVEGDAPKSELFRYNEKYKYGFCYESNSDEKAFEMLKDFVFDIYKKKIVDKKIISNELSDELQNTFEYENITRKLIFLINNN